MNNALFFIRNKRSENIIALLVQEYKLKPCYIARNEKIMKNENIILMLKKRYVFLRVFTEDSRLFSQIRQNLKV